MAALRSLRGPTEDRPAHLSHPGATASRRRGSEADHAMQSGLSAYSSRAALDLAISGLGMALAQGARRRLRPGAGRRPAGPARCQIAGVAPALLPDDPGTRRRTRYRGGVPRMADWGMRARGWIAGAWRRNSAPSLTELARGTTRRLGYDCLLSRFGTRSVGKSTRHEPKHDYGGDEAVLQDVKGRRRKTAGKN